MHRGGWEGQADGASPQGLHPACASHLHPRGVGTLDPHVGWAVQEEGYQEGMSHVDELIPSAAALHLARQTDLFCGVGGGTAARAGWGKGRPGLQAGAAGGEFCEPASVLMLALAIGCSWRHWPWRAHAARCIHALAPPVTQRAPHWGSVAESTALGRGRPHP